MRIKTFLLPLFATLALNLPGAANAGEGMNVSIKSDKFKLYTKVTSQKCMYHMSRFHNKTIKKGKRYAKYVEGKNSGSCAFKDGWANIAVYIDTKTGPGPLFNIRVDPGSGLGVYVSRYFRGKKASTKSSVIQMKKSGSGSSRTYNVVIKKSGCKSVDSLMPHYHQNRCHKRAWGARSAAFTKGWAPILSFERARTNATVALNVKASGKKIKSGPRKDQRRAKRSDNVNMAWGSHAGDKWKGDISNKWGEIRHQETNLCLNPKGTDGAKGTNVLIYTCDGHQDQKWKYIPATGEIISKASNRCLNVHGYDVTAGKNVTLANCDGGYDQKWNGN